MRSTPIGTGSPVVPRARCMLYSMEYYLSCWRFYFGATALGWHDRVKSAAAYYLPFQVKEDNSSDAASAGCGTTLL